MKYELNQRTLGYILDDKAKRNKEKVLLYFKDRKYSYEETNTYANRVANGYLSLGIKKGDVVVAMLPNSPEFIFHWFGLAKLGAIDSPINTAYKGDLLRHVINISGAKVILIHEEFLDRIKFIEKELPNIEKVIVFSPQKKEIKSNLRVPVIPFERLLEGDSRFSPPEEVKPHDPLQIIYTSGTTGPSKGAILPHHALYLYGLDTIESLGIREDDLIYSNLPLYHINIRFFAVMATMLNNGSFAMSEGFSVSAFWDEIRRYGATCFCFPGTAMANFIWSRPPKPDDSKNPARLAWMLASKDLAQAFEKRFGLEVCLGYFGMTEANWITSLSSEEKERLRAEGKWEQVLSMGREDKERYAVKLVNEEDEEVPAGEMGEIVCRPSRPFSMMTEYVNMPEKTLEVFRNLWFHTGDMAKKDEEGYFYFVDRKKDYLRRRGENISSFEVEKVLNAHPKVLESAVIGVKSEWGEDDIKAVIKLKEGEELAPEGLLSWCEERMAYFMIPRYIQFVKVELPKTPTGRVEKYRLREVGIGEDSWDMEKAGYKIKR